MRFRENYLAVFAAALSFFLLETAQAQYEVVPQGTLVRGNLWISDGLAGVFSTNGSAGDRLRIGGDLHFGDDYQYILSLTLIDRIWSGETSPLVGNITRSSSDLGFGYFVLPDCLWLMYSLQFQDVGSNGVIGTVSVLGHQLSVGYRFYSSHNLNMTLEGAYQFIPSYVATTYNYATGITGSASFPAANIWSLNLRIGFDMGGR